MIKFNTKKLPEPSPGPTKVYTPEPGYPVVSADEFYTDIVLGRKPAVDRPIDAHSGRPIRDPDLLQKLEGLPALDHKCKYTPRGTKPEHTTLPPPLPPKKPHRKWDIRGQVMPTNDPEGRNMCRCWVALFEANEHADDDHKLTDSELYGKMIETFPTAKQSRNMRNVHGYRMSYNAGRLGCQNKVLPTILSFRYIRSTNSEPVIDMANGHLKYILVEIVYRVFSGRKKQSEPIGFRLPVDCEYSRLDIQKGRERERALQDEDQLRFAFLDAK